MTKQTMAGRVGKEGPIWGPPQLTEDQWSEIATSAGIELSQDECRRLQSHVDEYIAYEIYYFNSARPKELAGILGRVADKCKDAYTEIWKLLDVPVAPDRYEKLVTLSEDSDEYQSLTRESEDAMRVSNSILDDGSRTPYEIARSLLETEEEYGKLQGLWLLLKRLESQCRYSADRIEIKHGRPKGRSLTEFFRQIDSVILNGSGKRMSRRSSHRFIYLLSQKIFANMQKFEYFKIYQRKAFNRLEAIANSGVDDAIELIRLDLREPPSKGQPRA